MHGAHAVMALKTEEEAVSILTQGGLLLLGWGGLTWDGSV
jgi:hypothetical protein